MSWYHHVLPASKAELYALKAQFQQENKTTMETIKTIQDKEAKLSSDLANLRTTVKKGLDDLAAKIAAGGVATQADLDAIGASLDADEAVVSGMASDVAAADPAPPTPVQPPV